MVVIKMRGGNHSKDIREYEITSKGVVIIGDRLTDYQGLITGLPEHLNPSGSNQERLQNQKLKAIATHADITSLTTGSGWSGFLAVSRANRK